MARLIALAVTLVTLHLGAAAALVQDAQDAYGFAHAGLNSLSGQVTSDVLHLHDSLSGSNDGS